MVIFRRGPPNGGVQCRLGRQKSRFWANIGLHYVLCTPSAIYSTAMDDGELMTLVVGKRRSLLMAEDDDKVYDKKPQRYAEDNVTQLYIWSLSNNNERLHSRYYFVEAKTRATGERKLRQGRNVNWKWSEIAIQISGLILIRTRMSTGSLPKCCGFIALSASVISPSFVQIVQWLFEKM